MRSCRFWSCPFDAELFGHWWFEGPVFLDDFMRHLCAEGSALIPVTPGEYLAGRTDDMEVSPVFSS
jgi:1,4-alpha-glucan branching enzyme